MTMAVEADSGSHPSQGAGNIIDEVPKFEVVFAIPATHRLLAVRSRSRGGLTAGNYWEHEEYDAAGIRVARYESFEEMTAAGARRCGWRKFDSGGRLVATGDDLA